MATIPIGDAPYKTADFIDWLTSFKNYLLIPYIDPSSITTIKFVDGSVTSSKLASNAVTNDKMADNSVSSNEFINSSIANADISTTSNITGDKFADGSITSSKISGEIVDNASLIASTLLSEDFATSSIDSTKLQNNSVGTSELATNAIANSKILDGTITGSKFVNGTITSTKISSGGTIDNTKIATNAVSSDKLNTTSVISGKFSAGSVTSTKIENDGIFLTNTFDKKSVTGAKITNNTITGDKFDTSSITLGRTSILSIDQDSLVLGDKYLRNKMASGISYNITDLTITTNTEYVGFDYFVDNVYIANSPECFDNTLLSEFIVKATFCINGSIMGDEFAIGLALNYYDKGLKIRKRIMLSNHRFSIITAGELLLIPLNAVVNQELINTINGYDTLVGDGFELNTLEFVFYRVSGAGSMTVNLGGYRSSMIETEV